MYMPRPTSGTDVVIYEAIDKVVPFFCDKNIHPNVITFTGFILNFVLLTDVSSTHKILAVLMNRLLDCLDGEVARKCDKKSVLGSYMDSISDILLMSSLTLFILQSRRTFKNISLTFMIVFLISLLFVDHSTHTISPVISCIHDNTLIVSFVAAYIAFK